MADAKDRIAPKQEEQRASMGVVKGTYSEGANSPSVDRAIQILDFLTMHPGRGFTVSEISRRLRISKSTARGVLGSLTARALLLRSPETGEYRLGPALIPMGAVAERALAACGHAKREAERLAEEYDGECLVVMATRDELLIVGYAGVPRPHSTTFREGQRQPLAPPLGTVILAWSSDDAVEAWLDRLGAELTEPEREYYRQAVKSVRERGYSVALRTPSLFEFNELLTGADLYTARGRSEISQALSTLAHDSHLPSAESMPPDAEIATISAPIFGPDGEILFAIALVPGPAYRARDVLELAQAPVRAAGRVMAAIDGRQSEAARRQHVAARA
jgi:DNA-binding IclR family transcriptional regulator